MIVDEIINDILKDKTEKLIWLFLLVVIFISSYYEYGTKGLITPLIIIIGFLGTLGGISEIYLFIRKKQKISKTLFFLLPLTIVLYAYGFVKELYMAIAIFSLPSLFIFLLIVFLNKFDV